jgi:signal transduction histidine kinase
MFSRAPEGTRSTAAWRISIWTTVAFSVGSALAFYIVYLVVANELWARTDAWLNGEAEVLAEVSHTTPRDNVSDRIMEEVAELATREVPDERNSKGQQMNSVFFLQTSQGAEPLWVGPGSKRAFVNAIEQADLTPRNPRSVSVEGWTWPFRVTVKDMGHGSKIYLGLSNHGSIHQLHKLIYRFLMVWLGMVILGFLISYQSARRTLRRVEEITETVSHIGSDDLSSRLPPGTSHDEISRLADTFNRMLGRIQASVSQLRTVTDAVAHDLKSPVTSIRGTLEIALSKETDWRENVAEAIEGLDRLSQLLNTTLDLAEAEAGALHLDRESVDLSSLVRRLIDLYQPAMTERGHELRFELEDPLLVDADVGLTNRMIGNLLDNELTHLPEGCRIQIQTRSHDGAAELLIEDNGPGFPAEIRAHVLERFVKGEHSSGHGLGLPLVDAVAQAHGGTIRIVDQPKGARIIVSLPMTVTEAHREKTFA